ncbi:MAG TPA: NAD(P)-binding domain-containing protein [Pseudolabrys sp.]|nr:NAD(P)-binding domain-containing protein [Pseudolabrys sp.]
MRTEFIDTLIIGGGQAGLAMSHMLSQRDCPNIVVERQRIAERWRTERWDGLRFQFPNWSIQLPDFPFSHSDPDAFATSDEIVGYLTAYAKFIGAPVRCGVNVQSLRRRDCSIGFVAETSEGRIEAANVVLATGPYQHPIIPTLLSNNATVFQVHSNRYRRPEQLPSGAVLVIGSGASGVQIAEELLRAGRQVYLSVGRHRRMPRRYRGRDLIWWLSALRLDQTPVEKRGPDRSLPLITGAYGGHTLDFRQLAAQGVRLLGHLTAAHDDWLDFAPDLAASLAHGDAAYEGFLDLVDAHVERNGLNVPREPSARTNSLDPADLIEPLRAINLRTANIGSVIWATGYGFDLSWIDVPVLDAHGQPLHRHGVTDVPGMYFIGLQWLSKMTSSFLSGVGDDAARLADHIAGRRNQVAA